MWLPSCSAERSRSRFSPGQIQSRSQWEPHIDLLFATAAEGAGNPLDWCTGVRNPPIHNIDRAIDVFGDDSDSLCYGDESSNTFLRARGVGGGSSHPTMGVWAWGNPTNPGCDFVYMGMIDVNLGLHGQLRYIHTTRTVPEEFGMWLYAAPSPGTTRAFVIGQTTNDFSGCNWDGYHVHQGTLTDCMVVNSALTPTTIYSVWHPYTFVNKIDYAEGLHLCDG